MVVLRTGGVIVTLRRTGPGTIVVNGEPGPNCLLSGANACPGGIGRACHPGGEPVKTEAGEKETAVFSGAVVTTSPV